MYVTGIFYSSQEGEIKKNRNPLLTTTKILPLTVVGNKVDEVKLVHPIFLTSSLFLCNCCWAHGERRRR
jgi:hypothetical protein